MNCFKQKKPKSKTPTPQGGMSLLQMLFTIGLAGLIGAWVFPQLLAWLRASA